MDIVERLKEVLKDDYGINNQKELEDAINNIYVIMDVDKWKQRLK